MAQENVKRSARSNRSKTKDLTISALMAALMCIFCPMSIPIGPIPVSLQIFMCLLAVEILDTKRALTGFMVYLLLGAAGMPVFSGFQGGLAKLTGPTGGFIIGFIFTILISGLIIDRLRAMRSTENKGEKILLLIATAAAMVCGITAAYFFGTLWFVYQANCDLNYALSVCVLPFIPLDLMKMIAAILLGSAVRTALEKSGAL